MPRLVTYLWTSPASWLYSTEKLPDSLRTALVFL